MIIKNLLSQLAKGRFIPILLLSCWCMTTSQAQCDYINDITGITQSVPPAGDAANPALYTQVYVLVDHLGIIHEVNSTPDFFNVPSGNYFLYAVNFDNAETAAVIQLLVAGLPWAAVESYGDDVTNCLGYTTPYTGCAISVCDTLGVCEGETFTQVASGFSGTGYAQTYCLVCNGVVEAIDAGGTFDLSTIPAAVAGASCQLMAVNYEIAGGIPVNIGDNWSAIEAAYCTGLDCFAYMGLDLQIGNTDIVLDSVQNILCAGDASGAAYITVNSGTAPLTFNWSDGSANEDLVNVIAGTYTVTVTDVGGCMDTVSATITEPATAIDVVLDSVNAADCAVNNGSIFITPTGGVLPYSYAWSNGSIVEDPSDFFPGSHSVTVTDANGCTFTLANIDVPNTAGFVITVDSIYNTSCNGGADGAIFITPSNATLPVTYLWSDNSTNEDATGLMAGIYTVTATDGAGCIATVSDTVGEPLPIELVFNTIDPLCNGGADGCIAVDVLNSNGVLGYNWSNGATSDSICGLMMGDYIVTVTDTIGTEICMAIDTATLGEPTPIVLVNDSIQDVTCNTGTDGTIFITASGGTSGYTYLWSDNSINEDATNLGAGSYNVTVTDANGCIDSLTNMTVTEPTVVTVLIDGVTDATCNGLADGTINITVIGGTPGYTYLWSNGETSEDITGLAAGNYNITATDINGCEGTTTAQVNEAAILDLTLVSSTDLDCNGDTDGDAFVTTTGGTPAYSYSWSNGATTDNITNVGAGNYLVTVTDANGCIDTLTVILVEPDGFNVTIDTLVGVTACDGTANGELLAMVDVITPTFSYEWSNGATQDLITGLAPGTYTVTVTDPTGCIDTAMAVIIAPVVPIVDPYVGTIGNIDTSMIIEQTAILSAGNDQTAQGVSYQWTVTSGDAIGAGLGQDDVPDTEATPVVDGLHTYLVTATSLDGCVDTGTVYITGTLVNFMGVPDAFTPDGDGTNDRFFPVNLDGQYISEFKIYNRFGELVYDDPDLSDGGWDGIFKNQAQARDIYMYTLEYRLPGMAEPEFIRGDVLLIR